jgi:hypothetical protein
MRTALSLVVICLSVAGLSAGGRDLSRDEAMGGHTLARHVGLTDAQLRDRLAEEPGISAASTYTDRATAERVVGDALEYLSARVAQWAARRGSRPNLSLHYHDRSTEPVGRSLERGDTRPRPCSDAVVVLRWDDRRGEYFILTSYPESRR